MNKATRLFGLAVTSVLGLSTLSFAQTGLSLITKAFEEGQVAELEVSYQWQDTGNSSITADPNIGLQLFDAQGRWQVTQDDLGLTLGRSSYGCSYTCNVELKSSW